MCGLTLEQVAQRYCEVSTPEDIQNRSVHGHEQCALIDSALSGGGVGLDDFQKYLPTSVILCYFK